MDKSILFLGKKDDYYCNLALKFCEENFSDVLSCMGNWGDSLPEEVLWWDGDYIISYLSRWVLPSSVLERAKIAAINFHPAPPEYPGIGCNNFALYEGAKEYGVTCHHMASKVDTGKIIEVIRFPLYNTDTVETILERTYNYQLSLFSDVMGYILDGSKLPTSPEKWARQSFTRKQFNELSVISLDMSNDEIARRVRATTYGKWKPYIDIGDFRFEYKGKKPNTP